jgi:hypothetical protein
LAKAFLLLLVADDDAQIARASKTAGTHQIVVRKA